jgi:hypothetical protein
LAEATTRADEAVAQIQTEALEKEREINTELRETLERVRTEFSLLEDSSKNELKELKARLEKEQQSSKYLKDELTAEITVSPRPLCPPPTPHSTRFVTKLIIDPGIEVRGPEIEGRGIEYFV